MPRKTDTRQKVLEAAREMSGRGQVPTVAAIRERIGGGSPNTIVSALRQWREGVVERRGPELASSPGIASAQAAALFDQLTLALAEVKTLLVELSEAKAQHERDRKWFEEQLELTQSRYAAVQTYMLRSIDEARTSAAEFKEKYVQATQELSTWRAAMTGKNSKLQAEIDLLKEQRDAQRPEF